jgi:hypothetical protein
MNNDHPYSGYEPNEPEDATGGHGFSTPRTAGNGAYHGAAEPSAWEQAGYLPNEPVDVPPTDGDAYEPAQTENRYTRPTWDEAAYFPDPAATPRRRRTRAAAYDASMEGAAQYTHMGADEGPTGDTAAQHTEDNLYRRPEPSADEAMAMSSRFAPPLKFELPGQPYGEPPEAGEYGAPVEPMLYRTRRPASTGAGFAPITPATDYRLEAEALTGGRRARRGRGLRRLLAALCVLAVLGGAIYLGRDFLLAQLATLLGNEAAQSVNQAVNQAIGGAQAPVAAFDAAPAVQVSDKAKRGIAAVAGSLALQTYAVTGRNVVTRTETTAGLYDYYLFAASDGRLLGYYEALSADDFLVCAEDVFHVPVPPYLLGAQGEALIDPARYANAAGADAVLSPLTGGWAIIANAAGTAYNYIDAKGTTISALWFAKVWPFTATATLAWVDTGNVTEPAERYALYEITRTGGMKLWKHASGMDEVLGCAAGVAVLADGTVVRLNGAHTVLCQTDEATVYADCGALVARDPATGKYALFVGGDQHYDFAYDRIAPVASDIRWAQFDSGLYHALSVTGMAYPLPLSHYFMLEKDGQKEMVALSTGSTYPLRLQ